MSDARGVIIVADAGARPGGCDGTDPGMADALVPVSNLGCVAAISRRGSRLCGHRAAVVFVDMASGSCLFMLAACGSGRMCGW
jgi:hypothetical protein